MECGADRGDGVRGHDTTVPKVGDRQPAAVAGCGQVAILNPALWATATASSSVVRSPPVYSSGSIRETGLLERLYSTYTGLVPGVWSVPTGLTQSLPRCRQTNPLADTHAGAKGATVTLFGA
jgi:hypothetical protein